MKESPNAFVKIGLVHPVAFPQVKEKPHLVMETIQQIALDTFFDAIEISHIPEEVDKDGVKAVLDAAHMEVSYSANPIILSGKLDLNATNEEERSRAVSIMKAAIDEAYDLGCSKFCFLSGRDPGEAARERAAELLVQSVKEMCYYAGMRGHMMIVLEPFDREVDKRRLIGPSAEAAQVAEAVRSEYDNFGLMVDLSHLPMLNETPTEAVHVAKDYLVHVHVGNCVMRDKDHPAYGDLHPRFGIEGGENDVPELVEFLRALFDAGYLGRAGERPTLAFEVKPLPGELPEVVIANAKRAFLEAWSRLEL